MTAPALQAPRSAVAIGALPMAQPNGVAPSPIAFPPEIYAPVGAQFIDVADTIAVLGAGTVYTLPGLDFTLPAEYVGVLRVVSLFVDSPALGTQIRFALLVNGRPYPGLGGMTIIGRSASSLSRDLDYLIVRLPVGAHVQMQVTDVDGGSYTVGAQLSGWQWQGQLSAVTP